MSRYRESLPPGYFEDQYASTADPWQLATSPYERAKYAATLGALPKPRYASALEVGCSIGVLTAALAERCEAVLGLDVAERALALARARCRGLDHVRFALARAPGEWPEGAFDLIVLSEVVYFLDAGDVARLVERVRGCLRPEGDVVLVHWTGETHYPLSGDDAAERFAEGARAFLRPLHHGRTDSYRLDVLARDDRLERDG